MLGKDRLLLLLNNKNIPNLVQVSDMLVYYRSMFQHCHKLVLYHHLMCNQYDTCNLLLTGKLSLDVKRLHSLVQSVMNNL